MKLERQTMLRGMYRRDDALDGRYLVAVQTTKIYCLPSCPARKPKPENVLFFLNPEAARAAGFRACRRCRPDLFHRGVDPDMDVLRRAGAAPACRSAALSRPRARSRRRRDSARPSSRRSRASTITRRRRGSCSRHASRERERCSRRAASRRARSASPSASRASRRTTQLQALDRPQPRRLSGTAARATR